ncbi:CaiF/GrlA family transcriptional regulator [Serratia marcescens]|uniref:CaiF/GrlA family transcriptional regulator n=1 Tax=Serratia marcescens TaxID=615 RepID=UPI0008FBD59F
MPQQNNYKSDNETVKTKKLRTQIPPRQSNHAEYLLPPELAHLPPMPFYLAVAHFGLLTGQRLTCESVCQAFSVPPRRATEVLRYIVNGAATHVRFELLPPIHKRGRRLLIHGVGAPRSTNERKTPPTPPVRRARGRDDTAREQQQMRQWFLRRPNP